MSRSTCQHQWLVITWRIQPNLKECEVIYCPNCRVRQIWDGKNGVYRDIDANGNNLPTDNLKPSNGTSEASRAAIEGKH